MEQKGAIALSPSATLRINERREPKGFAQVLILVILLLGVGVGAILVQKPNIFRSKADSGCTFAGWSQTYNKCEGQTGYNSRYDFTGDHCVNGYDYSGFITCLYSATQPTPTPTKTPLPQEPSGTPDLDVTYIERTPRYNYGPDNKWPLPGEAVTFTAHIRNMGADNNSQFSYKWLIDGNEVNNGSTVIPSNRQETTASFQWTWQNGNHTVKFQADPNSYITEISESNNFVDDRTNALAVGLWVEKGLRKYFDDNQNKLGIGSNSWEDWAQRQIREWNKIMDQSTYPDIPGGIKDRVRLDKIVVVNDGALPLNGGGIAGNFPDMADKTIDLEWGFPSSIIGTNFYETSLNPKLSIPQNPTWGNHNPFYIEYSLFHELSHARFLGDGNLFHLNRYPSAGKDEVLVTKKNGSRLLLPGFEKQYECEGGLMGCLSTIDRSFLYSKADVLALNKIAGKRASCANYNLEPGCFATYLLDVPAENKIKTLDTSGNALTGASVAVYQSVATQGQSWTRVIDNTADINCTTDSNGLCSLGSKPFGNLYPLENIQHFNGNAFKGVAVIKITKDNQEFFQYIYLPYANMAYEQGNTQTATYEIKTNINVPVNTITPTPTLAAGQTIQFNNLKPTGGSTILSPITFTGTIVDTVPWLGDRYLWLYIDGQKKEGGMVYTRNISSPSTITFNGSSSPQTLSPGTHSWYVKISDQSESVYTNSQTINLTVTTGSSPPPAGPSFSCTPCAITHNQSRVVSYTDILIGYGCLNKTISDKDLLNRSCAPADLNGDGKIDWGTDVSCITSKYNQMCFP